MGNIDVDTVAGFGDEWSRFDQGDVPPEEMKRYFDQYFETFPFDALPAGAEGFDLGCGSGRWAKLVAPRVGRLHCIDASAEALAVSRRNLSAEPRCVFHHASVSEIPLEDDSMDFGYSLGVLHHVPDTQSGITSCVAKLKRGAPFLLYLYYAFDNRPAWFRAVWRGSDVGRRLVSRLPHVVRSRVSDAIALGVYLPLARTSLALETLGVDVEGLPLSAYRRRSFYMMRTDALDRFGTRLERRFTKAQILDMMHAAGLENVHFGGAPFWCATGFKR